MEIRMPLSPQQPYSRTHSRARTLGPAPGPGPSALHSGAAPRRHVRLSHPPGTARGAAHRISPRHPAEATAATALPPQPLRSPTHTALAPDLDPSTNIAPVRADPTANSSATRAGAVAPEQSATAAAPSTAPPVADSPLNPADTANPEDGTAVYPNRAPVAPASASATDEPKPRIPRDIAQPPVPPFQVWSPRDLAEAFAGRVRDIEIRAHLDLTALAVGVNRDMADAPEPQAIDPRDPVRLLALFYAFPPFRSVRGNCSDADAATALTLTAAETATLLPLRPFQCMLLMHETFLVVNRGSAWVDNLYLKLRRTHARPGMAFISAGILDGRLREPYLDASDVYVTNVTFHAERRGSAQGVATDISNVSVYVGDCIFTDWTGLGSPLSIHYQSVANIENTLFRNMRLAVEVVDVSYQGAVRLANARFANVTLLHDRVVSTTANDYQQAHGHFLLYYADDDAAYDVPLAPVPLLQRSAHGEAVWVEDAVMSDCVWLQAAPDDVLPGCPESSAAARASVRAREDPALFPGISMQGFGAFREAPLAGVPLATEHRGGFAPGPSGWTGDYSSVVHGESPEYAVYDGYGGSGYPMGDYVDYELSVEDYKLANDPGRSFEERLLSASDEWLQRVREELPKRPDTWTAAAGPAPQIGTAEVAPFLTPTETRTLTRTLTPQGPPAANDSAHSVRVVLIAVGVAAAAVLLPACLLLAHMLVQSLTPARPRRVRIATRAAADSPGTADPERAASLPRQGTGGHAGSSRRDSAELDTGKAQAAVQATPASGALAASSPLPAQPCDNASSAEDLAPPSMRLHGVSSQGSSSIATRNHGSQPLSAMNSAFEYALPRELSLLRETAISLSGTYAHVDLSHIAEDSISGSVRGASGTAASARRDCGAAAGSGGAPGRVTEDMEGLDSVSGGFSEWGAARHVFSPVPEITYAAESMHVHSDPRCSML